MRTTLFALLLIALPALGSAQRPQTLIDRDADHGGFGAAMATATRLADQEALLVGGGGAWVIDHTYFVGGAGFWLLTDVEEPAPLADTAARRIDLGYGGLLIGYVVDSDQLIHWTAHALLGGGGIGYRDDEGWEPEIFLFAEPGVLGEVNIADFFRLGAGGAYRFVNDVELEGFEAGHLEGWSLTVHIKFGSF